MMATKPTPAKPNVAERSAADLAKELVAVKAELASTKAELDRLRSSLSQLSAAWRTITKNLG